MSFENLVADLEKDAKTQEDKIIKDAANQADAIRAQTKEQIAQLMQNAKREAAQTIEEKKSEISTANISARKIIADGRNQAVEKALTEVKEHLQEYTNSKQYTALVTKLTQEAVDALGTKQNTVVICRKEDAATLKKNGFNVQATLDAIGGVIVQSKDGKIKINSTFENLLSEHADELRQTMFFELFGKTENRTSKKSAKSKRGD